MGQKPQRMTRIQIEGYIYQTETLVPCGPLGPIQAGRAFDGPDGRRLVLSADNLQIVFLAGNVVSFQPTSSFVEDVRTHPVIRGAQGAVGMARFAQTTIDIIIGAAAVLAGGEVALAIKVLDIAKFVNDNRKTIDKVIDVLKVVLRVRGTLKQYAPTLYDKIVDALVVQAVLPYLPAAVRQTLAVAGPGVPAAMTPESMARSTGKLVATLGLEAVKGKLGVLKAVFKILSTVVVGALKAVPKAVSIKAGEYKNLAQSLVDSVKAVGVALKEDDVQRIFEEVAKNAPKIKTALDDLDKVLE